jgi:hypothetical protein
MAALRHVCISDLHLGAGYSLLTGIDGDGHVAPGDRCDTLVALMEALAPTLAPLCDDEPPTLVLLGDVLDMGLSPMGTVSQAFRSFLRELARLKGPRPLFSPRIRVVPGNHDHHLWRIAKDQTFLRRAQSGTVDSDLPRHTPLVDVPGLTWPQCELLTALARTEPGISDLSFELAYPNFGLVDAARRRAVVLHHGHYVDPMYRAMSALAIQAPRPPDAPLPPQTVAQIEAGNGPWVDFLWSDLGSAGVVGHESVKLYEVMRDPGASQVWSRHLSRWITSQLGTSLGLAGVMPLIQGVTVQQAVSGLVDATVGRVAKAQRDDYLRVATPDDVANLRWYLGGAVALQLASEGGDPQRLDLSFVFGHTHKPFQDELPVPGLARPVAVYNTGGWVMDQPTMTSTQGAAIVLIDNELNLASLRLFNDPVNGACPPVHVAGTGTARDRDNPMLPLLEQAVARQAAGWDRFSQHVVAAAKFHACDLLSEFFDTSAQPMSVALATTAKGEAA